MIKTLYPIFQHWSKTGSVWILSDLHFDDPDTKLMDPNWIDPEEQIRIINKKVMPNDTFICLGDIGNFTHIKDIRAKYKVLIMGNHDKNKTKLAEYFDEIYEGPLFISQKILLSHEPIVLPFVLNIHGHCHNRQEEYPENFNHLNLATNIVEFTPVNLKEIIKNGISKIQNIHRITIESAKKRKERSTDRS